MKVEKRDIKSLKLDPRNSREHPERNLAVIMESLQRFGQQKPVVILKGGKVIAGNGLVMAARELKWETISVFETTLAEVEARAYAITDNRTNELSEWNWEMLADELRSLESEKYDLEGIGWKQHEIEMITLSDFKVDEESSSEIEITAPFTVTFTQEQKKEISKHLKRMKVVDVVEGIMNALREWGKK